MSRLVVVAQSVGVLLLALLILLENKTEKTFPLLQQYESSSQKIV